MRTKTYYDERGKAVFEYALTGNETPLKRKFTRDPAGCWKKTQYKPRSGNRGPKAARSSLSGMPYNITAWTQHRRQRAYA